MKCFLHCHHFVSLGKIQTLMTRSMRCSKIILFGQLCVLIKEYSMKPCEVCAATSDSLSKVWDSVSRTFLMMCPDCVGSTVKSAAQPPEILEIV